jgi:uncharacterized protein YbjQ (UPF0145 family)
MTKNLVESRHEVIQRMIAEAEAKGTDAVLAMRFDTSEMGRQLDRDLRLRHGSEDPEVLRSWASAP